MEKLNAFKDRVVAIDILRGLTILVMVFVNDVSSVKGLPWWTYHMPRDANGMTYVDVVFPAFLFIVGMAIPLAFRRRLERGDSYLQLIVHIFIRSISLVIIGVLIMNGRDMDPRATGMSYALWNVLMFTGVILFWNAYPGKSKINPVIFKVLKTVGFVLLVVLLIIYKRQVDGEYKWIDIYNWSILGLIGWAYMSACIIYILFRKSIWIIFAAFLVLNFMNVAGHLGWITFFRKIPPIIWPFRNGSLASITVAGLLLSLIFTQNALSNILRKKLLWSYGFVLLLFVLGFLLLPFEVSKIRATPSWCLLCSAITGLLFLIIYWLVDMKGIKSWAVFLKPAGTNPLLTYILPDIFYAIAGVSYLSQHLGSGWPGVIRSIVFSLFILGLAAIFTRYKVRLQL